MPVSAEEKWDHGWDSLVPLDCPAVPQLVQNLADAGIDALQLLQLIFMFDPCIYVITIHKHSILLNLYMTKIRLTYIFRVMCRRLVYVYKSLRSSS